jgi:hypothetical protein
MSPTRELINAGALMRAVFLVRKNWSDKRIVARLKDVWPGYSNQTYMEVITLALLGVRFTDAIDWSNPDAVVDWPNAPRLPD